MEGEATKVDVALRIEREFGVLLHRVRRNTIANARAIHEELQPAAYPILVFVHNHDGARAADVADHFGVDKGSISRNVAHLERLGLLRRTVDPDDARAQSLTVTETGRHRLERLREERFSRFLDKLAGWPAEELSGFADQLHRYNESLED